MTGRARPALLHVCGRYLPLSETFTYGLITGMQGFDHHVVATSLEHLDRFPLTSVQAPQPESGAWVLARQHDVAAIVCHFGPQCTLGMPIGLMLGVPVVTIFHGYDISRLLRDRAWVERYRACFAAGMRALCISEAGRTRLVRAGAPASAIDVIHLGVDTRRFAYRPPQTRWTAAPRRLLMVARLVPKKGVAVALDALAALRDRGMACELRVVGDGPDREALHARADALGLDGITWMGALDHASTRQAFEWADIYLQPSVTAASGDEEGIPVALMEAMASGLPVVATRHSGIPELVLDGTTGLLTDEGDAQTLAAAIEALSLDVQRAGDLAHAARQWVEASFEQHRQCARVSAWMHDVLATPPTSLQRPRGTAPSRGLLLQTLPTALLARKLTLIMHRHPGMAVDILTRDRDALALEAHPGVDRVHLDESGADWTPDAVRARVDADAYGLLLVPWSDDTGQAEGPITAMAQTLGVPRVVGITLRDREVVPEAPSLA